ncbi:hypothetical protein K431DRAFT_282784 [Polychaeton citri CBS 116435]|uniref:ASST-domain-containing protein n=1 Tax=Polychaeton citri CBS 116435 TaxID=1314669 RepID=A0A9P4USE8_9PEZI|nr:hypothetical protein K431DRAFT_282784 [Polychaeton citri CBS 116435]
MDPSNGGLVWNGPETHAFSFGVQQYQGEPVLVYWNGSVFPEPLGRGNGAVYLLNKQYEQVAAVTLPGNFLELPPGEKYASNIDLHEIYLTEKGSVIITANNVTQFDLMSVGGVVDGWIVDALFYEIDIATNDVLFSWSSLDHVDVLPLTDSVYPLGSEGYDGHNQSTAWGYFHINAASPYNDGYILSSRFLCSAIAIGRDGSVKWRLAGRDSLGGDFSLGEGADFCYQHHIRAYENGEDSITLHLHDNANSPIENNTIPTSGKSLHADLQSKHVTLNQRYSNESAKVFATAQGSFQQLANGNVVTGHGWIPVASEFAVDGTPLNTWQYGANPRNGNDYISAQKTTLSYRSFKQQWVGCPTTKPAIVTERQDDGSVAVYISWNGATEVYGWVVLAGISATELQYVAHEEKTGFETKIVIENAAFVQARSVTKPSNSNSPGGYEENGRHRPWTYWQGLHNSHLDPNAIAHSCGGGTDAESDVVTV